MHTAIVQYLKSFTSGQPLYYHKKQCLFFLSLTILPPFLFLPCFLLYFLFYFLSSFICFSLLFSFLFYLLFLSLYFLEYLSLFLALVVVVVIVLFRDCTQVGGVPWGYACCGARTTRVVPVMMQDELNSVTESQPDAQIRSGGICVSAIFKKCFLFWF